MYNENLTIEHSTKDGQLFHDLAERSVAGIYLIQDGLFRYANPRLAEIFGYSSEEMKDRMGPGDLTLPDDRPVVEENIRKRLSGECESVHYGFRGLRKDGTAIHAEVYGSKTTYRGRPAIIGTLLDVTENIRSQDAIQAERNKFIKVLESMKDGVYIVNRTYDIEYINPSLESEFGPWKGIKCYTYFHDRREVCPWCPNEKVWAGETVRWEWKSTKNGKVYDLIDTPIRNPDGSILKLEIFRDITDIRQMERELKASEERYRHTLENMMEGCQIIGHDWRYLFLNDAAAIHGRRKKEDLLGRKMTECYPGIEKAEVFAALHQCMDDQISSQMENEFTYPDGSKAWFLLSLQPVPQGIFILSLDITNRKLAEGALRESEAMFRTLSEQSPNMIFINAGGRIVYVNNRCEEVMGYSREEFLSPEFDFMTLIKPEYADDVKRNFRKHMEREEVPPYEYAIVKKDGGRIDAIINTRLIDYEGESAILGMITDISEHREKEEKMKKYIGELERFQAATVQREFRVKELGDENRRLKARIEELEGKKRLESSGTGI